MPEKSVTAEGAQALSALPDRKVKVPELFAVKQAESLTVFLIPHLAWGSTSRVIFNPLITMEQTKIGGGAEEWIIEICWPADSGPLAPTVWPPGLHSSCGM